MNERIRELAFEAAGGILSYDGEGEWWLSQKEAEKFAELLIKRCGQVLVDNTPVVNLVEDWDKGYDRAMNDCIHHIYEHFGVEG